MVFPNKLKFHLVFGFGFVAIIAFTFVKIVDVKEFETAISSRFVSTYFDEPNQAVLADEFDVLAMEFADRRETIIQQCSRLHKDNTLRQWDIIDFSTITFLTKFNATYTRLAQVGTDSLVKYFSKLSNRTYYDEFLANSTVHYVWKMLDYKDLPRLGVFAKQHGFGMWELLERSFPKILFIRNPLDRILSAWNELMRAPAKSDVVKQIRTVKSMTDSGVTLFAFMLHLLIHSDSAANWNVHWVPQYLLCNPCGIRYDLIGTMENFAVDAEFIGRVLTKNQPEKFARMDVYDNRKNLYDLYGLLKAVPVNLVEAVLKGPYRFDYQIFGYNLTADLEKVYRN